MMNEPKCCPRCGKPIEGMKVETNIFDKEEMFSNCTVQVLTNTLTGETSVGWWENGKDDPQMWWTKDTIDNRLKKIVGEKNFVPWDERMTRKEVKDGR